MLCELGEDGGPARSPAQVTDLAVTVREYERGGDTRWVWPSSATLYQRLLGAGIRVARCHDVALADALILGRDAALGATRSGRCCGLPGRTGRAATGLAAGSGTP